MRYKYGGEGGNPVRVSPFFKKDSSPSPPNSFLLFNLTALFPELHVLHLLAALALKALTDQRGILLEAPLFAVFGSVKIMAGEMLTRQNFECLAAFHAGNRLFFDGFAGIALHIGAGKLLNAAFTLGNVLNIG